MKRSDARRAEGPTWLKIGRQYAAPILLAELPRELAFGAVARIAPPRETVELHLEAVELGSEEARTLVHRARAVAEAELAHGAGTETAPLEAARASAEELGGRLARREELLLKVGIRFVAMASSVADTTALGATVESRLSSLGFRIAESRYQSRAALAPLGSSAGGARPAAFFHTLPTDSVAAFYPFGDEAVIERHGLLVGLTLDEAAPVFLDRWGAASYSWGYFGATGSGKTFSAALTVLRSRWLTPDLTVIVLDPLGEFGPLARAIGGSVWAPGSSDGPRLNPLDPVSAGGDRREKAGRVAAHLAALFPSLRDEEAAALDRAVYRLYSDGPAVPTLGDLAERVAGDPAGPPRLSQLLEVFRSGSLAGLSGPTTVPPLDRFTVVDLSHAAENHLPFHLAYTLDWAYGQLRDRPGRKLLVVDEAHLLARHPTTADFFDRIVRHIRHYSAGLLVLSQAPDDFLATPSGRSILRNLRATFLYRLSHVSDEVRRFYGLTSGEADWLPRARLPREAGYAEALLRTGDDHLPLAVVAASAEYEFLSHLLDRPASRPRPDRPTA